MTTTASALFVAGEDTLMRLTADGERWAAPTSLELEGRIMALALTRRDDETLVHLASTARDGRLLSVRSRDDGLELAGDVAAGGLLPCSIAVSPTRRHLAVANYRSGSIGIHALDDRGLPGEAEHVHPGAGSGPDPRRQDGPHPHAVLVRGTELITVDLGADAITRHEWSSDGSLIERSRAAAAAGSGPRHAALVGESWLVSADELGASVSLFRLDPRDPVGELVDRLSLPRVPGEAARDYPSDVVVVGEHVYVATRGAGVITQLAIGAGRLVAVDEVASGRWPLKLVHARGRLYCAARDDGVVVGWTVDGHTGRLSGRHSVIELERPVWVAAC